MGCRRLKVGLFGNHTLCLFPGGTFTSVTSLKEALSPGPSLEETPTSKGFGIAVLGGRVLGSFRLGDGVTKDFRSGGGVTQVFHPDVWVPQISRLVIRLLLVRVRKSNYNERDNRNPE